MHFSFVSLVAALAATASAVNVPINGTTVAPYYPTSTGSAVVPYPTGTGKPTGTAIPTAPVPSITFFPGAASSLNTAGPAMALVVAGGVALMI